MFVEFYYNNIKTQGVTKNEQQVLMTKQKKFLRFYPRSYAIFLWFKNINKERYVLFVV